ncbi:hypothetical protein JRI60_52280 [Archangium violaceum]|uniref:hypothetical protein n=1 Tax=Archangium violaceum TaxID=83451 RepID=UPI0019516424|nr:hypothetical protein [Archangium violaceum]QRN97425.1 hypothetical protein JRI60_52280 [Archangium violaceum]
MGQRAMLTAAMGLLVLGTGCPHTYRKGGTLDRAMEKDERENRQQRNQEFREEALRQEVKQRNNQQEKEEEEDEERICPDDKVEDWNCRTLPCQVTCK